jgi:uncharacterized protein (TIGR03083 family)
MLTPAAERHDFRAIATALRREYAVLNRVLAALRLERWSGPSICAEWPLQKVVSHLGEEAEIGLAVLKQHLEGASPLGRQRRQTIWDHFDSLAPEPLYAAFRDRHEAYLAYLEALPADKQRQRVRYFAGEAPVGEYLQYRLNELALHSWDIRAALDPTARLLPDTTRTHLSYVLDTVDTVEQEVPADARARLAGTTYTFFLTGVVQREVGLAVGTDKLAVADPAAGGAVATLRLSAEAFIRLCAGRLRLPAAEAAGEITAVGDRGAIVGLNALFPGY